MSFFDSVVKAEAFNNLPYIEPGEFIFTIDKVLHITSKRGQGDYIVAEFSITEAVTDNPNLQVDSKCASRFKLSSQAGPQNAKSFMLAALGTLRKKAQDVLLPTDNAICVGEGSKLEGLRGRASAFKRPKATKPGEEYTHVNWFPVL
jgi:hypothetical protein